MVFGNEGENMIYITGDCHSDFTRIMNPYIFKEQHKMTKDDFVIIAGDFGGIWCQGESPDEKKKLDKLNSLSFTTLFIDGNHENYDRLYNEYPIMDWNGGKVHKIRNSVFHLMRGQVFELCGKKIFTFGGASSHDISGGVLEKDAPDFKKRKQELDREWISYRVNHYSWWKEELPSDEEMEDGLKNLEKNHNEVDYIITHCCASSTQETFAAGLYEKDYLTDYLDVIKEKVEFKKWFFGHYHINENISEKEICLYEQIIQIA